ncbi:MAG: beta-ketoacyl-ACP synthase [Xanthobacteraceae bacterium]|nr:beta-ketoacyl-ACP synthase [Xanthobacteraceae bacterium]QYK45902.1 MAG: beta-ketoacyl-ACP synthase [Xanthobacteraceae bacterium]
MDNSRDTIITGIGLLTSLGEGAETHLTRFVSGDVPVTDFKTYPTFLIHPLGPVDFDKQIPKKGDQRQMEPWQRIGTYTAGLALTDAGVAGNKEILQRMDMIVAAAGGERDINVDASISGELRTANNPGAKLNERLQTELRPTLFLAQLSNLLAGNISIVHGVTGSSRTFMGEESSGIEAVRVATARIGAGTSDIALVGGAYNAARPDMIALWEYAGLNYRDEFKPVFASDRKPGMATASGGAFLVLESRAHAEARGAKMIAKISLVKSARAKRANAGAVSQSIGSLIDEAKAKAPSPAAIFSTASGVEPATGEEAKALQAAQLPVRAVASRIGHLFEPSFPFGLAFGALAVQSGKLPKAFDGVELEASGADGVKSVIVSTVGHWSGEGVGIVEAAG